MNRKARKLVSTPTLVESESQTNRLVKQFNAFQNETRDTKLSATPEIEKANAEKSPAGKVVMNPIKDPNTYSLNLQDTDDLLDASIFFDGSHAGVVGVSTKQTGKGNKSTN